LASAYHWHVASPPVRAAAVQDAQSDWTPQRASSAPSAAACWQMDSGVPLMYSWESVGSREGRV